MKRKFAHIKSFTLMDVLSGMVITSIIIGLVFSLFTLVNKQLFDYAKSRRQLSAFLLLKGDLNRMFSDVNIRLEEKDDGIYFKRDGHEITLKQEGVNLLRYTNESIDTLSQSILNFKVKSSTYRKDQTNIESVHVEYELYEYVFTCDFYRPVNNAEKINQQIFDGI